MKKEVPLPDGLPKERRRAPGRRHEDFALPNFQDLIENAVQGILVHRNFKPLYVNASFAKLYGYKKPEDIMAMPLIRPLVPEEMWQQMEEDYHDLVHGQKKNLIARTRGLKRDGKEIWLSITERKIDWHGQSAVQVSAFDITTQVEIEQKMLDSEQVLRAMLEILPVPVYIARRADGQMMFVNRKTCLLLQQSTGPLLKTPSTQYFADPEDRARIQSLLDNVRDVREIEVRMRSAQGRVFTAELAAIVMNYAGASSVLVSLNDISQRKQLEAELFHQANTDSLTGLSNRRFFMIEAEQEVRRARRFSRALSIMMIDLDHFKAINDRLGHAAGDAVLEGVVKASLESLRESDIMGRLGGEEFGVLLPETDLKAALEAAERLRVGIAGRPIVAGESIVTCTASIGVAQLSADDPSIDELLRRADEAMYNAKRGGRNRVESLS